MDTIRLRILTLKSLLKFGPFKDLTVYEVIYGVGKLNHIINDYYNLSMVSFNDEVLDIVGITGEWRIEKPGKDTDKRQEFYKQRTSTMSDVQRMGKYQHQEAETKRRIHHTDKHNTSSKRELRDKNHGKH